MKNTRTLFAVLFSAVILSSCQKEPLSEKVLFPETTYEVLSPFDKTGKPASLLRDEISNDLLNFLKEILKGSQDLTKSHPELFNNPEIGDIAITKTSDVYLTFVRQEANYTNAIGFYTYPTTQPPKKAEDIKKIIYCFASAGNSTPLKPGDKVKLGTFEPGTSIGFVLMSKAWDPVAGRLDDKVVHFCSNDALNPEKDPKLKKHAVLIPYPAEKKVLIGFEDVDRTNPACDHDFDDVILYTIVTPK